MTDMDESQMLKIVAQDRLVLLQSLERFANKIISEVESMKREMSLIQNQMAMRNEKLMAGSQPTDSDESGSEDAEEDSE